MACNGVMIADCGVDGWFGIEHYLVLKQLTDEWEEDARKVTAVAKTAANIALGFIEPIDYAMTIGGCLQGDCSVVGLGLMVLPFASGSIARTADEPVEGLIRLVREDQVGTSQAFKLRKGEDGISVFENVSSNEVLDEFPGKDVPNTTVTILKDKLPPGTQVVSELDVNLSQRLSDAHRILIRPEGWSADGFAKTLKALVGWE